MEPWPWKVPKKLAQRRGEAELRLEDRHCHTHLAAKRRAMPLSAAARNASTSSAGGALVPIFPFFGLHNTEELMSTVHGWELYCLSARVRPVHSRAEQAQLRRAKLFFLEETGEARSAGGRGQRGRLTCRRPQCRPRACCISAPPSSSSPWRRRRPYFSASSRSLARSCSLCLEVLSLERAVGCYGSGWEEITMGIRWETARKPRGSYATRPPPGGSGSGSVVGRGARDSVAGRDYSRLVAYRSGRTGREKVSSRQAAGGGRTYVGTCRPARGGWRPCALSVTAVLGGWVRLRRRAGLPIRPSFVVWSGGAALASCSRAVVREPWTGTGHGRNL